MDLSMFATFLEALDKRRLSGAAMTNWFKQSWREFKKGRPGRRFQERYERRQKDRDKRSLLGRYMKPVAGLVLMAVGIVFCIIPGPGIPLVLVGAGLLAEEFRFAARALDWLEVQIRKLIRWVLHWWKHAPRVEKYAVLIVAAAALGAAGYGAYRVLLA